MPTFKKASEIFVADIGELKDGVEFAGLAFSVVRHAGVVINYQDDRPQVKKLRDSFIKKGQSNPESIYRGAYILLSGGLEKFIASAITEAIHVNINNANIYEDLPQKIRTQHFILSGRYLTHHVEHSDKVDVHSFAQVLGCCYPGNTDVRLNSEAFVQTIGNCNAKRIEELLEKLGISGFWDDVIRRGQLAKHFNEPKKREARKLTSEFLNKYIKQRNNLVHRGVSVAISESEFSHAANFFEAFARDFAGMLDSRIK